MIYFSTGQAAKKLGLTVRTLRYYDQIGLLHPSSKAENGKRSYSETDLITLEKITLLKNLAVPLRDIELILHQVSIDKLLAIHQQKLQQKASEIQRALEHTHTLRNSIKIEDELNWKQLLPLVHNQSTTKSSWTDLLSLSIEESEILQHNLPKMENASADKWINIIKRVQLCLKHQRAPQSEDGQLIAADILLLSSELFGHHTALEKAFWDVRKSPEASSSLNLYPIDSEVLQFIEDAIIFYEQHIKE
ncbi:MerR family transcriptional regulator [Priestia megaterium]|uniref:MerR family transcriptional regulator n=1 Tax=Priestia megaterium TaxID=1404 RepID=A0AAE5P5P9_PRIMG|nr:MULTISPECIES: MerR family transcriptional regulator [Priestia]RFB26010.1 MerR family transcriptional regulator [Bacillus sp. ALD]RFB36712.1 MerR family transcriptional regulator [Bacillus sp. RC]MBM6598639.1 MerR family transcriptional regulator [Priestia megaterium]MBW0930301.1 MerR family transcriptional regulator [Priestia megaterium]MDC7781702.1 MerR family transcriptional regulator [Priestia megaterium]